MSPEFWAIIGTAIYIGYSISSRTDLIRTDMQIIRDQLDGIDDLIGRIPGVESYVSPELDEWASEVKNNPDANTYNRRNWIK